MANSIDPDEMAHYDLLCLQKYQSTGLKGLIITTLNPGPADPRYAPHLQTV